MIIINEFITIKESEIKESFVNASGPGGQHVNKVSTAVQLRFNVEESSLSQDLKERLKKALKTKISTRGDIIVLAKRFKSQIRNREDALNRLIKMLDKYSTPPKKRKKTFVPRSSKESRLKGKKIRSEIKKSRRKEFDD